MTFQLHSGMETRIMTNQPIHIKAVLFRLEPTNTLLKSIKDLILKDLRFGIISRSDPNTVQEELRRCDFFNEDDIDVIINRPEIMRHRADANLILRAAQKMNIAIGNVLFISPHPSEIRAAHQIGAKTALMRAEQEDDTEATDADFEFENIAEIKDMVRMGIPLPAGKLPNPLLREFLNQFIFEDPSVLINPGVGEDIAAVDIESEEVLVLKSDPITFATDSIGQYAVLINANDIATSGAIPRWFLATLFFPCGTTPSQIKGVFDELKRFCQHWNITLCGGHTEITDAVVRPIVAGMMAGTVSRRDLIDKRQMRQGDQVLFSKGVAVEGTAIIAREFGDRLKKRGVSSSEIDDGRQFLDQISIMTEAKIAAKSAGTTAMHDVTEGGVATALLELSMAGAHKIRVDMDRIPVYPETQKVCDVLDIHPLGLIGSGSLLICCRSTESQKLMQRIEAAGIKITCIGEVVDSGQGIQAYRGNKQVPWPSFEADEITKLF